MIGANNGKKEYKSSNDRFDRKSSAFQTINATAIVIISALLGYRTGQPVGRNRAIEGKVRSIEVND